MRGPDGRLLVDRIWYGDRPAAKLARALLLPATGLYAAITAIRGAAYDRGILRSHGLALPAISVGNVTVGGTGKTPVAAWLAGELLRRGARPAIVLRGYGDDEPAVHSRLNPEAIVIANPDRVAGVADAASRGADLAVLDDAFQHRRARRDADVVLVSADRWPASGSVLPAGPFREPLSALGRASLVIVTRKAAPAADAARIEAKVHRIAPGVPTARVHLSPDQLVDVASGARRDLSALAGRPVVAVCGVGDPAAFAAQLAEAGAAVRLRAFPDHHAFDAADVRSIVQDAERIGREGGAVVCTLKDAVKLAPQWPTGGPALSYVSQHVILESGHEALDQLLTSVLLARRPGASATG